MKSFALFPLLMLLPLPSVLAGERTSANYTVFADALDSGGRRLTAGACTVDASLGMVGGLGTTAIATAKSGYAGQLYDVAGLRLAASPATVDEGATRVVAPAASLDDSTLLLLPPGAVTWSVASGPLVSVSAAGVATAARVYRSATATVRADWRSFTGTFALTVLNVCLDDFGTYAADQIDDNWQVEHFGIGNPLAAPGADASGTGQTNLLKYLAGLDPLDPAERFSLRIEAVTGQPGQKRIVFGPVRYDATRRNYTVVARSDLSAGVWSPLGSSTESDNGTERTVTDLAAAGPRKFYRIEITRP